MSEMSNRCSAVLRQTATRLRLSLTDSTAVRKLTSQIVWSFLVFHRRNLLGLLVEGMGGGGGQRKDEVDTNQTAKLSFQKKRRKESLEINLQQVFV